MKAASMLVAAAAAAMATPVGAAVFTYTGEVTLGPGQVLPSGFFTAPLPGSNIALQSGDEVIGSIRFANNERLTVSDNGAGLEERVGAQFGGALSTFWWTITGVQGEYLRPLDQAGSSSGLAFTTFGNLTNSSFSFTGADFRFLYRGDGPTIFDPQALTVRNARLGFGDQTAAVPEPTTWAMLIAGFGLVGAAMRRRRAVRPLAFA